MKLQTKPNIQPTYMTILAAALSLMVMGSSQAQIEVDDELARNIRDQLNASIPKWDEQVLRPMDEKLWANPKTVETLLSIVDDKPIQTEVKKPPKRADRIGDEEKVLRFRPEQGEVRYHSRVRAWNPNHPQEAVDKNTAFNLYQKVVAGLELPEEQYPEPVVNVQMVVTGNADIERSRPLAVYTHITAQRVVNGLPVHNSQIRLVVNNQREIQRLAVDAPTFTLHKGMKLLEREHVIEQAFRNIAQNSPSKEINLSAHLGYRTSNDEEVSHIPAVFVDVSDGETPYRITVDVAH